MSKPILAIRHVPHEDLGTLKSFLNENNLELELLDPYLGTAIPSRLEHYSGLIVMGGPMNVDETDRYPFLKEELKFLEHAVADKVPILGICLGAQLLAKTLGAKVFHGKQKEIGWYQISLSNAGKMDRIFQVFNSTTPPIVFHWHGDTFNLPGGAVLLASSELYQNQAFKYGENAYGLQFHVEMTEPMIRQWVTINQAELKSVAPATQGDIILAETRQHLPELEERAVLFYKNFFRQLGIYDVQRKDKAAK